MVPLCAFILVVAIFLDDMIARRRRQRMAILFRRQHWSRRRLFVRYFMKHRKLIWEHIVQKVYIYEVMQIMLLSTSCVKGVHTYYYKDQAKLIFFLASTFRLGQERANLAILFLEISWVLGVKLIQWAREAKHLCCTYIYNRIITPLLELRSWARLLFAVSKKILQLPAIRTEVCTALGIPEIPQHNVLIRIGRKAGHDSSRLHQSTHLWEDTPRSLSHWQRSFRAGSPHCLEYEGMLCARKEIVSYHISVILYVTWIKASVSFQVSAAISAAGESSPILCTISSY